MMRRVVLLAFISIAGIALLSPLSARSAAQLPDAPRDQLLARQPAPRADALRGGILTARGSTAQAAATTGAEALVPHPSDGPATVTMEATLVVIPTAAPAAGTGPAGRDVQRQQRLG